MPASRLEHVNFTVSNPERTAQMLCHLFGWHIRWQGSAINGGKSIHVGSNDDYVAIYTPNENLANGANSYTSIGGLNHLGIVVDDLDEVEKRVIASGYTPHSHADYEPGRRFYFRDEDNIEFEVVSYA